MEEVLGKDSVLNNEPGDIQPGCGTEAKHDFFYFEFVCYEYVSNSDEPLREGSLDLDDFQAVLDPYNRQIRINLTGAQLEYLRNCRSIMSRLVTVPPNVGWTPGSTSNTDPSPNN